MFVRQRVTCDGFVCVYYSCCLCACIPCCIDALRDVRHSCPNCNSFIGRFERLKWRCWKPVLEQATGCCCLLRSYVSYVVSFHAAIQTSSLSLSLSLSICPRSSLSEFSRLPHALLPWRYRHPISRSFYHHYSCCLATRTPHLPAIIPPFWGCFDGSPYGRHTVHELRFST